MGKKKVNEHPWSGAVLDHSNCLGGAILKFILTLSIIQSVIFHHVMYHCNL